MAILEEQITDTIEAAAPSIKYGEGDIQRQVPENGQERMMAQQIWESLGPEQQAQFITFEQFYTSGAWKQILAQLQQEQALQEQPMAYGGIAGLGGRRRYGLGSSIKKRLRKIIPNEVAQVAQVAAPFVAPFNPLIGGAMAGLGGFDRHGSLGKGLRSGLMTYGLGNVARYAGGAGPQWGLKAPGAGTGFGSYFTTPVGAETGIGKMLSDRKAPTNIDAMSGGDYGEIYKEPVNIVDEVALTGGDVQTVGVEAAEETAKKNLVTQTVNKIKDAKISTKAMMGILGVTTLAGLMSAMDEPETMESPDRGVGLPGGISGIRTEVIEAMKDPSGEKLKAIRIKYPFLGAQETKNLNLMAQGGRIGKAEGGIMDLDGMEKDYRETGGFVDLGAEEKADDVPARLSVNEFVMTADAVRGAGDGDIDLGAERMEDLMETLEAKNKRQQGASDMFEVSERLSAVV